MSLISLALFEWSTSRLKSWGSCCSRSSLFWLPFDVPRDFVYQVLSLYTHLGAMVLSNVTTVVLEPFLLQGSYLQATWDNTCCLVTIRKHAYFLPSAAADEAVAEWVGSSYNWKTWTFDNDTTFLKYGVLPKLIGSTTRIIKFVLMWYWNNDRLWEQLSISCPIQWFHIECLKITRIALMWNSKQTKVKSNRITNVRAHNYQPVQVCFIITHDHITICLCDTKWALSLPVKTVTFSLL